MSSERFNSDQEMPPPWFSNDDGPEPPREESSLWRTIIPVGVVLVVAVLLLIPVLQAELLQRRRASLPDAEMERAAVLFASAVLFGRSEGQALLFADDRSEDDIRSVLSVISERPPPSNQARLQVTGVPCGEDDGDGCFIGRLLGGSSGLDSGIRFGLAGTDGGPKVIWVELDLLSVRLRSEHDGSSPYWNNTTHQGHELIVDDPDLQPDAGFASNLFDRSHLVDLTVVLPDNAGQQVIHEFQQVVDVRSDDSLAAAQVVVSADEYEAIFDRQLAAPGERSADLLPNRPQVALAA